MADGPFFTFRFPSSLGGGDVVLRELTAGEISDMLHAASAASTGAESASAGMKAHEACIARSVYSIRGQAFPPGLQGEETIRKLRPKERQLIADAYRKIHSPDESESADFLGSIATSPTPPTAI